MSGRTGRLGIPIVAVLSAFALLLLYLVLHSWNIRLTQELVKSEQRRKLAFEKVESLEVELSKLQSFSRLESLAVHAPRFPEATTHYQRETMPRVLRVASSIEH